jgi:hypothetical protein
MSPVAQAGTRKRNYYEVLGLERGVDVLLVVLPAT